MLFGSMRSDDLQCYAPHRPSTRADLGQGSDNREDETGASLARYAVVRDEEKERT